MLSFSRGLWRHQNFMLLWVGQTVSLFGTQITSLALPTIAILLLRATPFEVGVLAAIPWVAYLGLGLFAGVAVDRMGFGFLVGGLLASSWGFVATIICGGLCFSSVRCRCSAE